MPKKFVTGWAEYHRREKTPPAHAGGSSRIGPAPHSPGKVAGTLFYLKWTFAYVVWRGAVFGGEF